MVLGRLDLRSAATARRVAASGWSGPSVASLVVADAYLGGPASGVTLIRTFDVAGWRATSTTSLAHGLYGVVPTGSWSWLVVRARRTAGPGSTCS